MFINEIIHKLMIKLHIDYARKQATKIEQPHDEMMAKYQFPVIIIESCHR